MKQKVVDANCFLRFLLNDIPEQAEEVEKLLSEAKNSKTTLFVPQIVLFEIQFSLDKYYHFQKHDIIERLESLVGLSYLEIQDKQIFEQALMLYKENSVSLVDCFLLASAVQEQRDIMTFDKKLQTLARKELI